MASRDRTRELRIQQINYDIDQINDNIQDISRLHERALVGVSQDESNKITRKLDLIQDQTNDSMNSVRMDLKKLSNETKRLGGSEAQSRQVQQGNAAKRLQAAAKNFSNIQTNAKQQYQKRMEREIRIARPDASDRDIARALQDTRAGSAFAQEMLNSRIGSQRRVLQEVQDRHEEMRKMEQSIEELATLFMDLQNLLETQQETINTIDSHIEYTAQHIEDGGNEIKRAISIRKSSRKKLWCIAVLLLILLLIISVVVYTQVCGTGICKKSSESIPSGTPSPSLSLAATSGITATAPPAAVTTTVKKTG